MRLPRIPFFRPPSHADEGGSSGHGGGGARWLVSYADFVTLMFGFFLILWASADQSQEKFSELAVAFQKALNSGSMLGQQGTGQIIGKGGRQGQLQISPFSRVSEQAGELAAQSGLTDQISVGMKKEGLVITLSGSLLFEPGKTDLRPEASDVLGRLASIMEPVPGKIRIEGHTDNIPISTPDIPSNWELSTGRAASVLRYFSETLGVAADRFEIAGYAEFRPVVPNDTRENRAKNRRVEIILMKPDTGVTPVGEPEAVAPAHAPEVAAPAKPAPAAEAKPAPAAEAKPAQPAPAAKPAAEPKPAEKH
jgi:chemotaxis protein MotB